MGAQWGSAVVRQRVAPRLARVAACLAMAGVAALPFAGGLAAPREQVATGPAPGAATTTTSTTTTSAPPTAAPAPTTPPTAPPPTTPPPAEVAVEAPPIHVPDPSAGIGEAAPVDDAAPVAAPGDATRPPDPSPDAPITVAAPAPPAPPTTTTTPPAVTAVDVAAHPERLWVVSIGIDDYPGERFDLQAADDDAVAVTDTFADLGVPADHLREVLDGEATVEGILAAVDWLTDHAGPDDTAVLFYAGHVRDLGFGTEVLVASDGRWVADWYLAAELTELESADAWIAIAGCFAGGFTELLAPGRILTGAAPAGQLAYESSAYSRSFMVEYLFARAIDQRGASALTVQAAVAWANEQLAAEHPDRVLFQEDDAGHAVSLDGTDRRSWPADGQPPPTTTTTAPPPRDCLLGLLC